MLLFAGSGFSCSRITPVSGSRWPWQRPRRAASRCWCRAGARPSRATVRGMRASQRRTRPCCCRWSPAPHSSSHASSAWPIRMQSFLTTSMELAKCESLCSTSLGNALAQSRSRDGGGGSTDAPRNAVEYSWRDGGAGPRSHGQGLPPLQLQDVAAYGLRTGASATMGRSESMPLRGDGDPAASSVDVYDTPYGPVFIMDGKPYDARGCEVQPNGAPLPAQPQAPRLPPGEVQVDSQGRRVYRVTNASATATPRNDGGGALPSLAPRAGDPSPNGADALVSGIVRQLSLGSGATGGAGGRGGDAPMAAMNSYRGGAGQGPWAERDQQGAAESSGDEGEDDGRGPVGNGGGYYGAPRGNRSRRSSSSDSDDIAAKIEAEYNQTVLRKAPKPKPPVAAASSSSSTSSSSRRATSNGQPASSSSAGDGSRDAGGGQPPQSARSQPRRASSQPALSTGGAKPQPSSSSGSRRPDSSAPGGANAGGSSTSSSAAKSSSASARPRPTSSSRQQQPAPSMPTSGFGRTASQPVPGGAGRRATSVGGDASVPQRASSSRSSSSINRRASSDAPKPTAEMLKVMKSNWDNLT
eukprot:jgi/Mesvir1/8778/Mv02689-RA.2